MARGEVKDILAQWRSDSTTEMSAQACNSALAGQIADIFKILSDPTRVRIIQALIANEEMRVRRLAEAVEMSQSSVSHHLRILRHFCLVRTRREGKEIYYSPDDNHVEMLLSVCAEHVSSDN